MEQTHVYLFIYFFLKSAPAAAHRLTTRSQLSLCVYTLSACEGQGPAVRSCWAPDTLIWGSTRHMFKI